MSVARIAAVCMSLQACASVNCVLRATHCRERGRGEKQYIGQCIAQSEQHALLRCMSRSVVGLQTCSLPSLCGAVVILV